MILRGVSDVVGETGSAAYAISSTLKKMPNE
jgi:hypothetical protein